MDGEQGLPEESRSKHKAAPYADIRLHPRRRGRGGKGKQQKFPTLVRYALWLGLPIGLWAAIYAVIRLLE